MYGTGTLVSDGGHLLDPLLSPVLKAFPSSTEARVSLGGACVFSNYGVPWICPGVELCWLPKGKCGRK